MVAFLEDVRRGTAERLKAEERRAMLAAVVFAYWAAKLHHPAALLDQKRERYLLNRLQEARGDVGILCYAVDGALRDDWIMGRDKTSRRKHDGIRVIFRDREQVEQLAELCPRFVRGEPHLLVVKYRMNLNP